MYTVNNTQPLMLCSTVHGTSTHQQTERALTKFLYETTASSSVGYQDAIFL